MTEHQEQLLTRLGFRFGLNGPHAARTMMLDDLRLLMAHTPRDASRADYVSAVVDGNVLGKPTRKARELALRHMATLYALDPANPIFRALRRLWLAAPAAQPLLALAVALARDPLLRGTQSFILGQAAGAAVLREAVEANLEASYPGRFSPASLKSFAQNVAGTWTSAGLLHGRVRKTRARAQAHPESITLLLFLGFLEGRTGQRLFSSDWMNLIGGSPDELEALANSASHRGLLVFMNAGGVKEVRFPGYLTPEEERIRQEVSHVVYLASHHQIRNLNEFLLHVAESARPKSIDIVTRFEPLDTVGHQDRAIDNTAKDLFQNFGVALTLRREANLHDRYLVLDHGVLFKLGRGLDIYKPATGLAAHRPASRRVREAEVDVFAVPGHPSTKGLVR